MMAASLIDVVQTKKHRKIDEVLALAKYLSACSPMTLKILNRKICTREKTREGSLFLLPQELLNPKR